MILKPKPRRAGFGWPSFHGGEQEEAIMAEPKSVQALKAEIERLQEAKRRALAIADERCKENVRLRAALKAVEVERAGHR